MQAKNYIPALRFHWLTGLYDWLIATFMPEQKFKTILLKNANIQPNQKVLDFGIGTATLSLIAFQKQPNANYIGMDIDDKILAIAANKIKNQNANISLIKYHGGLLPFNTNEFDVVISSLVFHHLTTQQKIKAFEEFKRILKPNGKIYFADWGKASNKLMRILFHLVQIIDGYKTTNDNVNGRLPNIIAKAGFNTIQINQKLNTILGTIELFTIKS